MHYPFQYTRSFCQGSERYDIKYLHHLVVIRFELRRSKVAHELIGDAEEGVIVYADGVRTSPAAHTVGRVVAKSMIRRTRGCALDSAQEPDAATEL